MTPLASAGSSIAAWTLATAEKEVPGWAVRIETTCATGSGTYIQRLGIVDTETLSHRATPAYPQNFPTSWCSAPASQISFDNSGTFFAGSDGLAGPAKKSPTFFFFSSVSGGKSL